MKGWSCCSAPSPGASGFAGSRRSRTTKPGRSGCVTCVHPDCRMRMCASAWNARSNSSGHRRPASSSSCASPASRRSVYQNPRMRTSRPGVHAITRAASGRTQPSGMPPLQSAGARTPAAFVPTARCDRSFGITTSCCAGEYCKAKTSRRQSSRRCRNGSTVALRRRGKGASSDCARCWASELSMALDVARPIPTGRNPSPAPPSMPSASNPHRGAVRGVRPNPLRGHEKYSSNGLNEGTRVPGRGVRWECGWVRGVAVVLGWVRDTGGTPPSKLSPEGRGRVPGCCSKMGEVSKGPHRGVWGE